jgi:hypothetical protein
MSGLLLISSLLLVVTLVWSVWDEVLGQRPWKGYQKDFVSRYSRYLEKAKTDQGRSEAEIKSSPEYQELDQAFKGEAAAAEAKTDPIDSQVKKIDEKISALTLPFQDTRLWIVATYQIKSPAASRQRPICARLSEEETGEDRPGDRTKRHQDGLLPHSRARESVTASEMKKLPAAERVQITQPREALRGSSTVREGQSHRIDRAAGRGCTESR